MYSNTFHVLYLIGAYLRFKSLYISRSSIKNCPPTRNQCPRILRIFVSLWKSICVICFSLLDRQGGGAMGGQRLIRHKTTLCGHCDHRYRYDKTVELTNSIAYYVRRTNVTHDALVGLIVSCFWGILGRATYKPYHYLADFWAFVYRLPNQNTFHKYSNKTNVRILIKCFFILRVFTAAIDFSAVQNNKPVKYSVFYVNEIE